MDSKKTQTVVVVILVITALLGIVGAALVYHLSTEERTKIKDSDQKEYCACVTAYTTPDCNDCSCTQIELQTLESELGEIINGVCSLDCESTAIDTEEREDEETISCLIPKVQATGCHSLSVRDATTKDLIIPPIPTQDSILITANFVPQEINGEKEAFTKFVFIVNGISTEVDASSIQPTTINEQTVFSPEMEFSDFEDVDTLTIQAIAYSDRNPEGTTPGRYCYKQYDLTQEKGPFCSNLALQTQPGSQTSTKVINQMELSTPNLTKDSNIELGFTFDHSDLDPVRTKILPTDLLEEIFVREKIFLEYEHLYSSPELYVNNQGFPIFNEATLNVDAVGVSVQLYVDDKQVDSSLCSGNVTITIPKEEEEGREEDQEREDQEEKDREQEGQEKEEEREETPTQSTTETKPDIVLTMEGPTCVHKAADSTSVSRTNYRITIKNNSNTAQDITSITNKLPVGFEYIVGTTSVNRALVDDTILSITNIGQTQEMIWTHNWTITPQSSLVIEYGVNVTESAIDGENQNEAVAKSASIPQDTSKLRAEVVTIVGEDCEHQEDLPETGHITFLSLAIGLLALLFGISIYKGKLKTLDSLMYNVLNTKPVKKIVMPTREYFEDSILEKEDKED